MMPALRLLGSLGSGSANILLYGSILALWPGPGECPRGLCGRPDPGLRFVTVSLWHPFIDNPGAGWAESRREPRCRDPEEANDSFNLVAAPLPAGYDPHAYDDRPIYVCVLVGADGTVRSARMLRGTGEPGRDAQLLGTIRRSWSFRTVLGPAPGPSWQRVRLSAGAIDGSVWTPLALD